MPDIRTTRVALLVDREVDREVRVARLALLVDRETDVDIIADHVSLIADIEHDVNIVVDQVYLIADLEDGYPWGDIFSQTDEFTAEKAGDGEAWLDEQTQEVELEYTIVAAPSPTEDTWIQTDVFKSLRADLWELYQNIVAYINANGLSTPVPPGPAEYDIDDNGRIQSTDALLVYNWFWNQVLSKTLRTTDQWFVHYHNWPSTPRSWADTWTQVSTYQSSLQRLSYNDIFNQTDLWYNPGEVSIALYATQTQVDLFGISTDTARWQDHLNFDDVFDMGTPTRGWADTWTQTQVWANTNLSQTWIQSDLFAQGVIQLARAERLYWRSDFKAPEPRTLYQSWVPTELWDTGIITVELTETWAQIEDYHPSIQSAEFTDFPLDIVDLNGNAVIFGMVAWLACDHIMLRDFRDTINWFEQWQRVLPTEELVDTITHADEFEANPLWEDLIDNPVPVESWQQWSGYFYDDILYQTSTFNLQHNPILTWADIQTNSASFNYYQTPSCITPYGVFTLIDATQTLVLRNAKWGNTTKLVQQVTRGVARSGSPYTMRLPYWPQSEQYTYLIKPLSED